MPPSVGSDSTSGTVNGAGANQFLRCSPLVQASKTSSRGASWVRVTSISCPSPTAVLPVSLISPLPSPAAPAGSRPARRAAPPSSTAALPATTAPTTTFSDPVLAWNVGEAEDADVQPLDVDQVEIRGVDPVVESFAAAGNDREQPEQIFVDQSVVEQRPAERAAGADLEDVAARLFLQLSHGVDDVASEQRGVPLHLGEGARGYVLGDGVHPDRVVTECLLQGGPHLGVVLVREPPVEERVDGEEQVLGELLELARPPGGKPVLRRADLAVQGDDCLLDDPRHPSRSVSSIRVSVRRR